MRTASVTPKIAASMFPPSKSESSALHEQERPTSNISRRRTETSSTSRRSVDEFDDGIDDDELVKVSLQDLNFDHINNYANPADTITRENTARNTLRTKSRNPEHSQSREQEDREPRQLENGKWACNHPCKDKDACKHLCCKQGMDKPSKKAAPKRIPSREDRTDLDKPVSEISKEKSEKTQTKLQLTSSKRKSSAPIEELDLTQQEKKKKANHAKNGLKDVRELKKLHRSIQEKDPPSSVSSIMHQTHSYCYGQGATADLSFLGMQSSSKRPGSVLSSDYGDLAFDDLAADLGKSEINRTTFGGRRISNETRDDMSMRIADDQNIADRDDDPFDEEDSMLEDMLGVVDSEDLTGPANNNDIASKALDQYQHHDHDLSYLEDRHLLNPDYGYDQEADVLEQDMPTSSPVRVPMLPPEKGRSLFLNSTSSPQTPYTDFKSAQTVLKASTSEESEREDEIHYKEPMGVSKFFAKSGSSLEKEVRSNEKAELEKAVKVEVEFTVTNEPVPDAYQGLEPWLFHEFGDIVEIVD
jgi:ATP-dependent DNA helicase HFM1/MER3